tara:strand:+ start:34863 stop:35156 length:294 start_codon:yes stop_codon:yes gene_type:complete
MSQNDFECPACGGTKSRVNASIMVSSDERHRSRKCCACQTIFKTYEQRMATDTPMQRNHKSHFELMSDYALLNSENRKVIRAVAKACLLMEKERAAT